MSVWGSVHEYMYINFEYADLIFYGITNIFITLSAVNTKVIDYVLKRNLRSDVGIALFVTLYRNLECECVCVCARERERERERERDGIHESSTTNTHSQLTSTKLALMYSAPVTPVGRRQTRFILTVGQTSKTTD